MSCDINYISPSLTYKRNWQTRQIQGGPQISTKHWLKRVVDKNEMLTGEYYCLTQEDVCLNGCQYKYGLEHGCFYMNIERENTVNNVVLRKP